MKKLILLILVSFVMISCFEPEEETTGCKTLNSSITEETILDGCYNAETTAVKADLIIKPGTKIIFKEGTRLRIYENGSISAVGTKEKPIVFTGKEKTKGYWEYIEIDSDSDKNELVNVIIEYGGGGSYEGELHLTENSTLKITDTLIQESKKSGFHFYNATINKFERVTSTNNEEYPGYIDGADIISTLDSASDFTGNGKDFIYIAADNEITKDQTWNLLNVPILIYNTFSIHANLTLSPGIKVVFEKDTNFRVYNDGSLNAVGTTEKPIIFTGKEKTKGYWEYIEIDSDSDKNELVNVIIEYGGGGGNYEGELHLTENSTLKITDTLIQESKKSGFHFYNATINKFERVTSTNNEEYPGYIDGADIISTLDSASDFTGNGKDFIYIAADNEITKDQTWNLLSVPISIYNTFSIHANLTLSPGCKIIFEKDTSFRVYDDGSLSAIGTEEKPIVFAGKEKIKSYWSYIGIDSQATFEHCQIEDGEVGIKLEAGSNTTIKNNLFKNGDTGIYIYNDYTNNVTVANIENNLFTDIRLNIDDQRKE